MPKEKLLYWAPNARWSITKENRVKMESFLFSSNYTQLFPKLYFLLSEGITERELLDEFASYPQNALHQFLKKMISARIIITSLQTTSEVFSSQERLFQPANKLSHDYFMNAENVSEYRNNCLRRTGPELSGASYEIDFESDTNPILTARRSIRNFDKEKVVSKRQFQAVLASVTQYHQEGQDYPLYPYPSAGGLYPIDCYIFIKPNRVSGFKQGLYYYDPIRKSLNYVSEGKLINRDCHYFINKDIFQSSAFSIFLVYNAEVNMPKYGGKGYFYGMLDAGIMIGYLNIIAAANCLGCCCIGELKFSLIKDDFLLNEHQLFLHCIEFGNQ